MFINHVVDRICFAVSNQKKHICLTWPYYYILWWMRLQVLSHSIIFWGCQKKWKKAIHRPKFTIWPLNRQSLAGGNSFSYLQAQRIWRHLTHQVVGKDVDLSGKWKYAMSMQILHMFMHIIYSISLYIYMCKYIYIYYIYIYYYMYIYIYIYRLNIYIYIHTTIYIYTYVCIYIYEKNLYQIHMQLYHEFFVVLPGPNRRFVGRADIMGGEILEPTDFFLPNLVMTNSSPWYRWPIEIDGFTYEK